MFSNVSYSEFLRSLELSNDAREREIAEALLKFGVTEPDQEEITDTEIESEIVNASTDSVHLVLHLQKNANWYMVTKDRYVLEGFNEDTHPFQQHIELRRVSGKDWVVSANVGFVYSRDKDKYHGERLIEIPIYGATLPSAKKEATRLVCEELVPRNLLYSQW